MTPANSNDPVVTQLVNIAASQTRIEQKQDEALSRLDRVEKNQGDIKAHLERHDEQFEEVKSHLSMQDGYMKQSFEHISDTLDHEERIRQNERDIDELKRQLAMAR